MTDLQTIVSVAVFSCVILSIALNIFDIALAGMLGVSTLLIFGIITQEDILNIVRTSGATFALLFGGMVVARSLTPTGIFDQVAVRFLRATRGSGRRYLLGLFVLTVPLCMFLPNATTVMLLAPVIIYTARALKIDIAASLIITAIISNSAGLLTLVGDPATFLVASSIGMTFIEYLKRVSIGGLMTLIVLIPLLPWLMKDIWQVNTTLPDDLQPQPLQKPHMAILSLSVLGVMVFLFLFGENMRIPIVPAAAAIIACSLALLVIHATLVEPVGHVLRDVDWKTLIFLACMFILVEAFTKTGFLDILSGKLYVWFGANILPLALVLTGMVGAASSVLANIPIVAAMTTVLKGYCVAAELVPEEALGSLFTDWPLHTLPLFVAMMFGGTLGGNSTLIGASANVVVAGISGANGKLITFKMFLRYGLPFSVCQLTIAMIYVGILYFVIGK